MTPRCDTCVFWVPMPGAGKPPHPTRRNCRRFPPILIASADRGGVITRWPTTFDRDWCGEHTTGDQTDNGGGQ